MIQPYVTLNISYKFAYNSIMDFRIITTYCLWELFSYIFPPHFSHLFQIQSIYLEFPENTLLFHNSLIFLYAVSWDPLFLLINLLIYIHFSYTV